MKKVLLITLALLLASCGVVQPVEQQPAASPVVQTVVVTVIAPTDVPPPTAVPTEVPPTAAPTETLVPTAVPAPTEALPTVDPAASNNGLVPVSVPTNLGKGVFTNITFSSDLVSLRCFPREMQISITPNLPDIKTAVIYYRIIDNPAALYPSEWQNLGEMDKDGNGNFVFTFKGETVNPNLRLDKAWVDFQFIGLNKGGGVVDRTDKIERLVTFLKDCE